METDLCSITSIAIRNHLKGTTLIKQYRNHLSEFHEWKKGVIPEALVYPENFGEDMAIDEVVLQNGELYTLVTNKRAKGKQGSLAALIKGTKASMISAVLMKRVPVQVRYAVKEITLDLAPNMDWICRECFPNAVLTADRFHFQQVVSEGVQELRIKYRREAIDEENELILEARKQGERHRPATYENGDTKKQLLARSRHLLFKPVSRWSTSQHERAQILFREFPRLKTAYNASMMFRNIFETAENREDAKKRLERWYEKISTMGIKEMLSPSNTIATHQGKILNYFHSRATNAYAESFNAKIKGFRSLLRGVRDINFFLFRIEKLFA